MGSWFNDNFVRVVGDGTKTFYFLSQFHGLKEV